MAIVIKLWRFLLSPAAGGLAGLFLAIEALLKSNQRSPIWIVVASGFIVANSVFVYLRERTLRGRLARLNVRLYDRLLDLIGSLGEISADKYQCWKVELYLAHWQPAFSADFPWIMKKVLVRDASADIAATINLRDTANLLELGPVGTCYREVRQIAWLNPTSQAESSLDTFGTSGQCDVQLIEECGAMRLAPIVSRLNADCIGVLCVHTEPQYGPLLAGTAFTDQFSRRLLDAANDLHVIVRDDVD